MGHLSFREPWQGLPLLVLRSILLKVNFEWDPQKAERNQLKHGVSFREAASIFADPLSITYDDPVHSGNEHRFITVGMSYKGRVLLAAHVDRRDRVRIISARQTTRRERKHYEEEN